MLLQVQLQSLRWMGALVKTLPKAQRTGGLSSYHKITLHSSQILNILQFQNLDYTLSSKSKTDISILTKSKVKILTKPSFRILTKIHLRNLHQTSGAKYWPNFSFKILPGFQIQIFKILTKVLKVWAKVKLYDQTSASKSATNCCQHDPHH